MPARRRTPPRTLAAIVALGVIPPALIFWADAKMNDPGAGADAGVDGSAGGVGKDAGGADREEPATVTDLDKPSWDDDFLDFQGKSSARCNAPLTTATMADIALAQGRERDCVERELAIAIGKANTVVPADKRAAFATLAATLGARVERLCALGDEEVWVSPVAGVRRDGEDGLIKHYLPCQREARQGLLYLFQAMAAGEMERFGAHLAAAQPIGQASKDAAAEVVSRSSDRWDRGLSFGMLRYRGGPGVLGPRAWANLGALGAEVITSADRFGEAMCEAFPALAGDRGDDCREELGLYFFALSRAELPDADIIAAESEQDPFGPSVGSVGITPLGLVSPAIRAQLPRLPSTGDPVTRAAIDPFVEALKRASDEAFRALLDAQPARAAARIREEARWASHAQALCRLDEELFWRGPHVRYHGEGEGVVEAMCLARAHALRLVELGQGALPMPLAVEAMEQDGRAALDRLEKAPPALLRPPRAPGAIEREHATPLTPAEEQAVAAMRSSVLASATALATAGCAAWAREDRPPLDDCNNRLRAFYLSAGAFSSAPLERGE
ncbi:MAG: hypothetical protein U0359_08680 [Byssovorax sp.]